MKAQVIFGPNLCQWRQLVFQKKFFLFFDIKFFSLWFWVEEGVRDRKIDNIYIFLLEDSLIISVYFVPSDGPPPRDSLTFKFYGM
jgi:hypothetical protein